MVTTGGSDSEWTVVTVLAHLERRIDDLRTTVTEWKQDQQVATKTAIEAVNQALDKALATAEKALEQRAVTLDREFHEHLDQVRHENALAFLNSDKAVVSALASAKEAVTKAENYANERFAATNEFRGQLADQAATLVTRQEAEGYRLAAEVRINSLSSELDKLEKRMDLKDGQSSGTEAVIQQRRAQTTLIVGIAGAVLVALSIVTAVILGFN